METLALIYIFLCGIPIGYFSGHLAEIAISKAYKARKATSWRIIKIHLLYLAALSIAITLHVFSVWTILALLKIIT